MKASKSKHKQRSVLTRLRRNFIIITMTIVGVVLGVALGVAYYANVSSQRSLTAEVHTAALEGRNESDTITDSTSRPNESLLTITVDVLPDGSILPRSSSPVQISEDTLYDLIVEALSSDSSSGDSQNYPIAWMRTQTDFGWRIAFADTYARDLALRSQAINELIIFFVAMGALLVLVTLLARWTLKPVERAWEQQHRFISDASHELKTPLAVILANTQILEADNDIPDESKQWIQRTADEASHMKSLVEDLLTLARTDEECAEGTQSKTHVPCNFSDLVEGCALEFDAVAFERGCTIEEDITPHIQVVGNADELGRIVRTLLDNATKYAKPQSAVKVGLHSDTHSATLTITNQSDPIAPEDLAHLFDRFYRTDTARKRQKTGGFGLGLAIAKSLVEAHGGKISATSSQEAGTTFTVVLPL